MPVTTTAIAQQESRGNQGVNRTRVAPRDSEACVHQFLMKTFKPFFFSPVKSEFEAEGKAEEVPQGVRVKRSRPLHSDFGWRMRARHLGLSPAEIAADTQAWADATVSTTTPSEESTAPGFMVFGTWGSLGPDSSTSTATIARGWGEVASDNNHASWGQWTPETWAAWTGNPISSWESSIAATVPTVASWPGTPW
ncbi:hypothetical protein B0H16DRAFT_1476850 [Mycena metata]|uniref:Uncharacterized protein n=1 Tax=Mycena metata TaxID=1033252 RepID=A0AAD7HB48_9AGAR|nr:hypothetical protein B0H16DRAFT_1476850 [Mycena metata]